MKLKKVHEKIFVVWTFSSIIGMIVAGFFSARATIMIFGQYFLIMGLIILFYKHLIYISLHLITIGMPCLVIPILQMFPEINNSVNWDFIIIPVILYQFIHVGLGLIISQIKNKLYMIKKCTFEVYATIESYKYRGKSRCPVYSFVYNGKVYSVSDDVYSNIGVPRIGTSLEIKINPNDPEKFITDKMILGPLTMGIIFYIAAVSILIYVLFSSNLLK